MFTWWNSCTEQSQRHGSKSASADATNAAYVANATPTLYVKHADERSVRTSTQSISKFFCWPSGGWKCPAHAIDARPNAYAHPHAEFSAWHACANAAPKHAGTRASTSFSFSEHEHEPKLAHEFIGFIEQSPAGHLPTEHQSAFSSATGPLSKSTRSWWVENYTSNWRWAGVKNECQQCQPWGTADTVNEPERPSWDLYWAVVLDMFFNISEYCSD